MCQKNQYYWDTRVDYLTSKHERDIHFNDDYLEFLVKNVWKLNEAKHIADFGCGCGYMGIKLLPLLPAGSSYTGIDKGVKLIQKAKELISAVTSDFELYNRDLNEVELEKGKYDIAICRAVLMHVPNPKEILKKMVDCIKPGGLVICIESHWNSAVANFYVSELEDINQGNLGLLQKLFFLDAKKSGKDGNIGIKIPVYMRELGLKGVQIRVSDAANYLHPELEPKEVLHKLLCDEGWGRSPGNRDEFVNNLINRGATSLEAFGQYGIEATVSEEFRENGLKYNTVFAPTMMISFGWKDL